MKPKTENHALVKRQQVQVRRRVYELFWKTPALFHQASPKLHSNNLPVLIKDKSQQPNLVVYILGSVN